jgi:hypothetical protein
LQQIVIAVALLTILGFFARNASAAGEPAEAGRFKDWTVYTATEPDGLMCFAASQPIRTTYIPNNVKSRDPAFFMITNMPSRKVRNEASTIIGYPFENNSFVVVEVDGKRFEMFTNNDMAWLADLNQGPLLLDEIRGGRQMVVQGKSRRGTQTTDTYSLAGSAAAVDEAERACGTR